MRRCCHFRRWQLLGTESFPALLTRKAQVALCPLPCQVTGSVSPSQRWLEWPHLSPPSLSIMLLVLLSSRTRWLSICAVVCVFPLPAPPRPRPLKAGIWVCLGQGWDS